MYSNQAIQELYALNLNNSIISSYSRTVYAFKSSNSDSDSKIVDSSLILSFLATYIQINSVIKLK